MEVMLFQVGDIILRRRRKETVTVLRYENGHYILSDSKNGFGQRWWNKYIVERQFKKV